MIRIAVLADIHGNLPALEAVLEDVAAQQPDEVLVGGDLVGRGPCGKNVVQRITEKGWRGVRGNHEDYLLAFRHKRVRSHWLTAPEWTAARWMAAELDEAAARTIEGLPLTLSSRLAPELRLVHGSPRSNSEGIGPWTSRQRMETHLAAVTETVLVCGHTHRSLECRLPTGVVANVGSVGLPFNRDRRAQYALFHFDREEVEVEFRRMVPFIAWARARGVQPLESEVEAFQEFYDPDESFRTFSCRMRELGDASKRLQEPS